ncbi:RidA family protein [Marinisporobacter balticus]|uniref:Enamine deaminase RidA (YjgF/YER057c/UK114 family) n=1 Tax=Marinisporobacter balticus TaxID=2018667 RepID=A0A4V2SAR8_9FIRM|nr:RidA family protein [Marinisporobacter balticus]TCO72650.1 enamine deaminase RidA (YjgF/YER057c/UK114 family) [Marinisporobacter balticus]
MGIKRFEGTGRMSRAVVHNGTVYLCGQTCSDEDKDIKEQTKVVLEKIEALLDQYGSDKQHILSTTIYIKDMALFQNMNEVWDAWVENGFEPARACVEAKMAREEILIEMSVVAAVK